MSEQSELGDAAPNDRRWRELADGDEVADALLALFAARGGGHYDEAVSQTEHAVQCAELAQADGSPPELAIAALLHDVGHLLEPSGGRDRRDLAHERIGAAFLANWFGAAVTAPIRLHVAAKRYLCAVDGDYYAGLSPASQASLELQGGPMSAVEVAAFGAEPGQRRAVSLRRWDDSAKRVGLRSPSIESFRPLLARHATRRRSQLGTT